MPTDTARLIAAGITRVPFSLENAGSYCPGKRIEIRNALAGLCIACDIRDPGGRMEPAAFKRADGCIECPNWREAIGDVMSLHGGADCAPADTAATPCGLGDCEQPQHMKE